MDASLLFCASNEYADIKNAKIKMADRFINRNYKYDALNQSKWLN